MNALLMLIPVSLLLMAAAVAIFFWAVRHDQFQDLDTPGILPLLDDDPTGDVAPDAGPEPDTPSADTLHDGRAPEDDNATRRRSLEEPLMESVPAGQRGNLSCRRAAR